MFSIELKSGTLARPLHGAVCSLFEPTPTGPASDVNPAQMTVQLGLPGHCHPSWVPSLGSLALDSLLVWWDFAKSACSLTAPCLILYLPPADSTPPAPWAPSFTPARAPLALAGGPGLCALCCTSHVPSSPRELCSWKLQGTLCLMLSSKTTSHPGGSQPCIASCQKRSLCVCLLSKRWAHSVCDLVGPLLASFLFSPFSAVMVLIGNPLELIRLSPLALSAPTELCL